MDLMTPLLLLLLLAEESFAAKRKSGPSLRQKPPDSESALMSNLLDPDKYQKSDAPLPDRPTEVKLGIYVNSFYSISEQTMDYSISFYLRQSWRDHRLVFSPFKNKKTIKLFDEAWKHIWVPDTFFRNEKRADYHTITVDNRLIFLNITGNVWYVSKISATLSCPMTLQKYPMDTQECPMMFESFGYTMDTMYFQWLPKPVDINQDLELPQFTLSDTLLIDCSQNYTTGAFPCQQISFVLQRDIGYFLIQVYVPSILIVILSWVSFWINIDAIPARVSLGLLTVLTMTTQSTGANASLPRVSYIKAIDVWMSTCLIFVFTGLLEFAVVNVVSRKGKETRLFRPPPVKKNCTCINIVENGTERKDGQGKPMDPEGKYKARRIDKISRKCFPLAFLLFNIVYWIFYTCHVGTYTGHSSDMVDIGILPAIRVAKSVHQAPTELISVV